MNTPFPGYTYCKHKFLLQSVVSLHKIKALARAVKEKPMQKEPASPGYNFWLAGLSYGISSHSLTPFDLKTSCAILTMESSIHWHKIYVPTKMFWVQQLSISWGKTGLPNNLDWLSLFTGINCDFSKHVGALCLKHTFQCKTLGFADAVSSWEETRLLNVSQE